MHRDGVMPHSMVFDIKLSAMRCDVRCAPLGVFAFEVTANWPAEGGKESANAFFCAVFETIFARAGLSAAFPHIRVFNSFESVHK